MALKDYDDGVMYGLVRLRNIMFRVTEQKLKVVRKRNQIKKRKKIEKGQDLKGQLIWFFIFNFFIKILTFIFM